MVQIWCSKSTTRNVLILKHSIMLMIIILVLLLIVWVFVSFKPTQQEKQASAELEERLKDERIYDSVTGRYLTLEEAENEIIHVDEHIDRIKSDEEIEKNYHGDQREVEYIVRHMIQSGITDTEDERIYELIGYSKIFESAEDYSIYGLWEIKPDHFLGIAYVTSPYNHGRSDSFMRDHQLIGIVQQKFLDSDSEAFAGIEFVEFNETQIFKITKKIEFSTFKRLRDLIEGNDQPV